MITSGLKINGILPTFQYVICEPVENGDELILNSMAGFNNEGDVEWFVENVEKSEGFTPIVMKYDHIKSDYVVVDN
ncbi:MAG: hypothetical protein ACYTBJ_00635 [Planctomycetota bacterium]|jgi:hypothetical protein